MAWLDSLRNKFDNGGIGLQLDSPNRFRWADGEIPVTVTVTGHKTEPRTIYGLHFVVSENEPSDDSSSTTNSGSKYLFEHMR